MMSFLIGLLIGVVVGVLSGVALAASGKLHPGNCMVCRIVSKGCGKSACEKPPAE
jgi:hypothetical protein